MIRLINIAVKVMWYFQNRFSFEAVTLLDEKDQEEENKLKMYLTHLVKTGMNHILHSSPNTCCRFLRIPTLKPFLSGPVTKMGAEKASGEKKKKLSVRICLQRLLRF